MAKRAPKSKAPLTTAQQLGSILKSCRDIMRKDKGLNGDLDRLPMITWIMFLKFFDDIERLRETEALLEGKSVKAALQPPYRWRDWAVEHAKAMTGPSLMQFINQDEVTLPGGETRGAGLFAYLRALQGDDGRDRRDVIATIFKGVSNRMESGYLLRDVINKINEIQFQSSEEIHTLSRLYESMLKEMRDAAGDSGEFYTPRPVVQFMVKVLAPKLGEVILDPACGTGGFLVEVFKYLSEQCQTVEDRQRLQTASLMGGEAKSLPYLLAQMNLLLHGLETPNIDPGNSLRHKLTELGDNDRVDVILTNPPFGGEEEKGIQGNFPDDKQTSETALLFLQLIMRRLRKAKKGQAAGRAGVVVPNGTLFGDGVSARIKKQLLTEFNLHTIVRLPNGVFAPYTSIPTNLLFFDRSGPTEKIWYYELPLPEGRKNYTKTKPIQINEFDDCVGWWEQREANEQAWTYDFVTAHGEALAKADPHWQTAKAALARVKAWGKTIKELDSEIKALTSALETEGVKKNEVKKQIKALKAELKQAKTEEKEQQELAKTEQKLGDDVYWPVFNLDQKNPNGEEAFEHRPPEELVEGILQKEQRILEILGEIKDVLVQV
ncbi:MAG: N-6 DNA methylase [Cyanobacteria bacterium P01_D01_bin.156]